MCEGHREAVTSTMFLELRRLIPVPFPPVKIISNNGL